MDYPSAFTDQISQAKFLYGQQDAAIAPNRKMIPFTRDLYARAISKWYYDDLIALARTMRDQVSPNALDDGSVTFMQSVIGNAILSNIGGGVFLSNLDSLISGGPIGSAEVIAADAFPSSALVLLGERIPSKFIALRQICDQMGRGSAKALAAMETASLVPNDEGFACLDPASAVRYWEGWRMYVNAAGSLNHPVAGVSFWNEIKQSVDDLPETAKDLAEGAGELAADALVFTGETIGRTAKGFFSELGTDIIWVGGLAYLGWRYAL